MAAWIVIAESNLDAYIVSAYADALRSAALGDGQIEPFGEIMRDRSSYIRNRISGRVSLSATPFAVPPELKTCAVMLITEAMSARLSIALELTEDQRSMIRRAYIDLDMAGTEDFPISTPDDPITPPVQSAGGITVVTKRPRTETGETMAGL